MSSDLSSPQNLSFVSLIPLLMALFFTMAPSWALYCIIVFWQHWMKRQGPIETAGLVIVTEKLWVKARAVFFCLVLLGGSLFFAFRRRLMWMAALQRTILGGERMAAVWLHDAQIQKQVSHSNWAWSQYVQYIWDKDEQRNGLQLLFGCVCL